MGFSTDFMRNYSCRYSPGFTPGSLLLQLHDFEIVIPKSECKGINIFLYWYLYVCFYIKCYIIYKYENILFLEFKCHSNGRDYRCTRTFQVFHLVTLFFYRCLWIYDVSRTYNYILSSERTSCYIL